MRYKIGEVSKILSISKEMIRYYEKKGALTPYRGTDNNYRSYSTMDVFLLMEISRYQAMDFSVKEITNLLKDHYLKNYSAALRARMESLEEEVHYKELLGRRISYMAERAETAEFNMGRFWIKKVDAEQGIFILEGKDDTYQDFALSDAEQDLLFTKKTMPFFESTVVFEKDRDLWYYTIAKEYAQKLGMVSITGENVFASAYCLCTIADMGEIGSFQRTILEPVFQQAARENLLVTGVPRGIIIGRGYENGIFRRFMEIQLPVKL